MSKRPLRATGFTRFFIVMLFVAPLAYLGASYYNGEDGMANIKRVFKINGSSETKDRAKQVEEPRNSAENEQELDAGALKQENKKLKEELEFKKKRIDELYLENENLKRKLESAEEVVGESKK